MSGPKNINTQDDSKVLQHHLLNFTKYEIKDGMVHTTCKRDGVDETKEWSFKKTQKGINIAIDTLEKKHPILSIIPFTESGGRVIKLHKLSIKILEIQSEELKCEIAELRKPKKERKNEKKEAIQSLPPGFEEKMRIQMDKTRIHTPEPKGAVR